ncbi:hypothetical protein H9Y04_36390 [Streptomyces sp. TRM66268-LWL]|uniref:Uncharacterized protein n=1 Tax=Streptomyces polyasparticus TaxID=2767826 RepID=A0ABR7SR87_9ACTN|nr:hypothetical protein [Streptomyces polyasparticus]MBC9718027.1 hypothetical protein [Streptomyces polyasparticus]
MNKPEAGPGTRLLAEYLHTTDPRSLLGRRHPAGEPGFRLARALVQTAAELDTAYAHAQSLGRQLRRQCDQTSGTTQLAHRSTEPTHIARDLEAVLAHCELIDTALVRLLAAYLDLVIPVVPAGGDATVREATG